MLLPHADISFWWGNSVFWDYFIFALILLFGLVNAFWPNKTVEYTWVVRHGIDEEGRKFYENGIRFLGIFIVFGCIIWLFSQFN